jgi:hypothetical protein
MASDLNSRISGKVVHTERRSFGSGDRAFKFLEVHVQTSVTAITPVRFTDRWEFETPRAGDPIDVEVQVSGFSGRNGLDLSATAVRPYDESYYREALEAFTGALAA